MKKLSCGYYDQKLGFNSRFERYERLWFFNSGHGSMLCFSNMFVLGTGIRMLVSGIFEIYDNTATATVEFVIQGRGRVRSWFGIRIAFSSLIISTRHALRPYCVSVCQMTYVIHFRFPVNTRWLSLSQVRDTNGLIHFSDLNNSRDEYAKCFFHTFITYKLIIILIIFLLFRIYTARSSFFFIRLILTIGSDDKPTRHDHRNLQYHYSTLRTL